VSPRSTAWALRVGSSILLALTLLPVACSSSSDEAASQGGSSGSSGSSGDAGGGEPPKTCEKPADCESKVCKDGVCQAPSPADGVQNGGESDVDCGGSAAPKCGDLKRCATSGDCTSGVCKDLVCQPPAIDDGAKNGDETDVDCGGPKAPKCADGKSCKDRADCTSDICTNGKCVAPTPADGVKNGTETDIDCGGPTAARCDDTKTCLVDADCKSDVCTGAAGAKTCAAPSPTDGKKNGTETDVDCGGTGNPKCATGKTCLAHADCASDGCAYNNKCAPRKSCTGQYGGDTCGAGGAGGVGAQAWESCCETAPAGGVQLDKYKVTAGRMREFIKRTNGNVRAAVQAKRAQGFPVGVTFPESYDLYLPTALDGCDQTGTCGANELTDHFYQDNTSFQGIYTSVYRHLGGSMFNGQNLGSQGCRVDAPGSHTYWMDAGTQNKYFGDRAPEHSQAIYDTKPLNCVDYLMAQAFCLWDGGRLETFNEWLAAWGGGSMPWGAGPTPFGFGSSNIFQHTFPTMTNATVAGLPAGRSIEHATYLYSYEYPGLVQYDYVVFMSAPGRTIGRGPFGHADIVGDMMEVTSDVTVNTGDPRTSKMTWSSNGSFEGHGWSKSVVWTFTLLNKYGKQGLRCAYP
jgi:hypothetical protein